MLDITLEAIWRRNRVWKYFQYGSKMPLHEMQRGNDTVVYDLGEFSEEAFQVKLQEKAASRPDGAADENAVLPWLARSLQEAADVASEYAKSLAPDTTISMERFKEMGDQVKSRLGVDSPTQTSVVEIAVSPVPVDSAETARTAKETATEISTASAETVATDAVAPENSSPEPVAPAVEKPTAPAADAAVTKAVTAKTNSTTEAQPQRRKVIEWKTKDGYDLVLEQNLEAGAHERTTSSENPRDVLNVDNISDEYLDTAMEHVMKRYKMELEFVLWIDLVGCC